MAIDLGWIPWRYNQEDNSYYVNSVEYKRAFFLPKDEALKLLKEATLQTSDNVKKTEMFDKAFKKLVQ